MGYRLWCIGLVIGIFFQVLEAQSLERKEISKENHFVLMEPEEENPLTEDDIVDEDGWYLGLGIGLNVAQTQVEQKGTQVNIQIGYNMSEYLSIEGRYSRLISDVESNGTVYKSSVENIALHLKQSFPITDFLTPYALVGYGVTSYGNQNEHGLQWGLGIEYHMQMGISFYYDYLSVYNNMLNTDQPQALQLSTYNFGTLITF